MNNKINTTEETNDELVEEIKETLELPKPIIPVQKVSKIPNFPNGNHFWKWVWGFNMNQKQRPWRAASRWR